MIEALPDGRFSGKQSDAGGDAKALKSVSVGGNRIWAVAETPTGADGASHHRREHKPERVLGGALWTERQVERKEIRVEQSSAQCSYPANSGDAEAA